MEENVIYTQSNEPPQENSSNKSKKGLWIALGIIGALIVFGVIFGVTGSNDQNTNSNAELLISNVSMTYEYNEYLGYTVKITGIAKNNKNRNLSYASVEFSIYDENGNNLGTALDNMNNLGKDETWRFEATYIGWLNVKPASFKLADITAF